MTGLLSEFVSVVVDGTALSGFDEIAVQRALKNAAIGFTLVATWPQNSPQARALVAANTIEIYTQAVAEGQRPQPGAGELLCRGAVDSYEADIGEGEHKKITLHGRSHARDVVDCPPVNHPTLRVENQTLLGVAQNLLSEFNVGWATDQALDVIPKVQAELGETGFATIEREARIAGVLLTGQPDGSILITRAGDKRHTGSIVEGEPPVERLSVRLAPGKERSQVVVRGQSATGTSVTDLRQEQRYAPPNAGSRHRPGLVPLEGNPRPGALTTRGAWHHLRSFGTGTTVSPRVSRWRDDNGVLWTPGLLMPVSVPSELIDMDMLLSEAVLAQKVGGDGGSTAALVFVDPRTHGGAAPQGKEPAEMNPGDTVAAP